MRPTLFEIGSLQFGSYVTALAVAFIVGTLLSVHEANRGERAFPLTPHAGLCGFLGALIGAKLFWILQFGQVKDVWRAVLIWEPGLVYYGGLIGGIAGAAAYVARNHFSYCRTGDIAAPYLALGQGITRIGCFLNGCCWGTVAEDLPWAVQFPKHSPAHYIQAKEGLIPSGAAESLPVHPTQLYMVLGLATIFVVLKWQLGRKHAFDGVVSLQYFFLYGCLRFVVEFYRGDSARSIFGLTVAQAISLVFVVGAVVVYMMAVRTGRRPVGSDEAPERSQETAP
ncbi:MAG TPA: prolipoprotein diacylglyceryl transferase [Candidatus Hydrogenedentes bacterium]|nr:prolipoprotein diacylglyceryl transferase [Candidatus Hydrogenedentota bacterium]HPG67838.1 prolipoprotein diacylglyceryl transferase [Candidatus Hydrogenedentota bacterium]